MTIEQVYTIYPSKFNSLKLRRDAWRKKYAKVNKIGYFESLCYNETKKPISLLDMRADDYSIV